MYKHIYTLMQYLFSSSQLIIDKEVAWPGLFVIVTSYLHKAHLHWQKPGVFCCTVYTARKTHNFSFFWQEKRMRKKNPNLILFFW